MRPIDADALEELFREVIGGIAKKPEMNGNLEHMVRASAMVIEMIKDAPTIEPDDDRWIPCSERLPENGRQVLVFARSAHFALAKYDEMREADGKYKKQWVTFDAWKPFYTIKEVIAWMPLPEPYKRGGGGGG